MSDTAINTLLLEHDTSAEWRKLFKLEPHHAREIVFGYLLRLVVAVAAVIIPSILLLIAGFFNHWQMNNYLLVFFGLFIAITVFLGEHLRSLAYERSVSVSAASAAPEEKDYLAPVSRPTKAQSDLAAPGITSSGRATKRAFDIFIALSGIVLLAPLLVVSAVAVKFDSTGPILFRQRRLGLGGRPFLLYKFRTMRVLELEGKIIANSEYDSRVTAIGRVLRQTSLDELPQLFNVLRGDMSVVGPRPGFDYENIDQRDAKTSLLYTMKPGISRWAQVRELASTTTKREIDDDLWYIVNWSMWLDLRISLMSAFSVFRTFKSY